MTKKGFSIISKINPFYLIQFERLYQSRGHSPMRNKTAHSCVKIPPIYVDYYLFFGDLFIQQCFFLRSPKSTLSVSQGVKQLFRAGKDIRNDRTPLQSWEMIELDYTFHLKKTVGQSDFSSRRYHRSKVPHRGKSGNRKGFPY